jgi:hypothetical protein
MIYKLTISFLLLFANSQLFATISIRYVKQIDESKVVLHFLPACIVPINDSILYFSNRSSSIYISNFMSGETVAQIDLEKVINLKMLSNKHFDFDTSDIIFNDVIKTWKARGQKNIMVESIVQYSDNQILAIADINLPKMAVIGSDTEISAVKVPFCILFNIGEPTPVSIEKIDLRWVSEKRDFESPMFGCGIFNDNIYIAKTCMPYSNGSIFSVFNKYNFRRQENNLTINHLPYTSDLPTPSYFQFIKSKEGRFFVSANARIYDVIDGTTITTMREYDSTAKSIDYFVPISIDRYLVFYTVDIKGNDKYKVGLINIKSKKIADVEELPMNNSGVYKNKIITVEKREEGYFYVVRTY